MSTQSIATTPRDAAGRRDVGRPVGLSAARALASPTGRMSEGRAVLGSGNAQVSELRFGSRGAGADGAVVRTPSVALMRRCVAMGAVLLGGAAARDRAAAIDDKVASVASSLRAAAATRTEVAREGTVSRALPAASGPSSGESDRTRRAVPLDAHLRGGADAGRPDEPQPTASAELDDTDPFAVALETLAAAVDRLGDVDLTRLSDVQVEDGLRRFVQEVRRLPAVRHTVVAEAMSRCLPGTRRAASTAAYLRDLVRITLGEGRAWERDALDLTPRRSMTSGERLPAKYPTVAAAVEAGAIGETAARLITGTLRRAPAAVSVEERTRAELRLVRCATRSEPSTVARRCQEELDRLDPDGSLGSTPEERDRARMFRVGKQDRHGMYPVHGRLDPETGALLQAALSPLAAPVPGPDGSPDLRTHDQRQHDALGELARRALAAGDLPVRHGLPATLLLTVSLEQLESRMGTVPTGHGGRLPIRDLLRLACELGVIPIVFDADGQVLHYGREQRLATTAQRLALSAQDGGCTYEGCTIPAVWCQSGHGEPFRRSGRTTINDLALLCGHHHRVVDRQEWRIERIRGRAWLTPPKWIDPDQRPRINEHFVPLRE